VEFLSEADLYKGLNNIRARSRRAGGGCHSARQGVAPVGEDHAGVRGRPNLREKWTLPEKIGDARMRAGKETWPGIESSHVTISVT